MTTFSRSVSWIPNIHRHTPQRPPRSRPPRVALHFRPGSPQAPLPGGDFSAERPGPPPPRGERPTGHHPAGPQTSPATLWRGDEGQTEPPPPHPARAPALMLAELPSCSERMRESTAGACAVLAREARSKGQAASWQRNAAAGPGGRCACAGRAARFRRGRSGGEARPGQAPVAATPCVPGRVRRGRKVEPRWTCAACSRISTPGEGGPAFHGRSGPAPSRQGPFGGPLPVRTVPASPCPGVALLLGGGSPPPRR